MLKDNILGFASTVYSNPEICQILEDIHHGGSCFILGFRNNYHQWKFLLLPVPLSLSFSSSIKGGMVVVI